MSEVSTSRATHADRLRSVVSADGTGIVLEQVTDGDHDLLLVPGGPSRRTRWAAVAAGLAGRWSCWLVDRRGRGDSGDTAPYALVLFGGASPEHLRVSSRVVAAAIRDGLGERA